MKIWGVLCFVSCITNLHAHVIDVSDRSEGNEQKPGINVIPYVENTSLSDDASKKDKAERSSILKENRELLTSSKEEKEKPESYLIVVGDKLTPPGGGLRVLDPKLINEKTDPLLPEASWWEEWWNEITAWFSGEPS